MTSTSDTCFPCEKIQKTRSNKSKEMTRKKNYRINNIEIRIAFFQHTYNVEENESLYEIINQR